MRWLIAATLVFFWNGFNPFGADSPSVFAQAQLCVDDDRGPDGCNVSTVGDDCNGGKGTCIMTGQFGFQVVCDCVDKEEEDPIFCPVEPCCEEECCALGTRYDSGACAADPTSPGWVATSPASPECVPKECCGAACCGGGTAWNGVQYCFPV